MMHIVESRSKATNSSLLIVGASVLIAGGAVSPPAASRPIHPAKHFEVFAARDTNQDFQVFKPGAFSSSYEHNFLEFAVDLLSKQEELGVEFERALNAKLFDFL